MRMKMSRSVSSVEVVSRLEMRALGREPGIQDSGFRMGNEVHRRNPVLRVSLRVRSAEAVSRLDIGALKNGQVGPVC